jgi:hypothetical protein
MTEPHRCGQAVIENPITQTEFGKIATQRYNIHLDFRSLTLEK